MCGEKTMCVRLNGLLTPYMVVMLATAIWWLKNPLGEAASNLYSVVVFFPSPYLTLNHTYFVAAVHDMMYVAYW